MTLFLVGYAGGALATPTLYSVRSNDNDHLYSIDAATGVATDLGGLTFGDAEGMAFAGSTLYAIGGSIGEFWNITTPPGSKVGDTGPRNGKDAGLDYDTQTGTMYNINADIPGSSLYTINLATGAATLVGSNTTFADGLAINSVGTAYAVDGITTDSLYTINLATAAVSLVGGLGLGDINQQSGLAFGSDGMLYMINNLGGLYSLSTATGTASLIANVTCGGTACGDWEGLAAERTTTVPEPGTLALLGGALLGLVSRRRHGFHMLGSHRLL